MRRLYVLLVVLSLCITILYTPVLVKAGGNNEPEWMGADYMDDLGYDGTDVVVAVIDSGAIKHQLYSSNELVNYWEVKVNAQNELYCQAAVVPLGGDTKWDDTNIVSDSTGHGTAMVGAVRRMAPDVKFVIYEANAVGSYSKSQAVDYALSHLDDNNQGVDIMTMSLGTSNPGGLPSGIQNSMETSLENIRDDGITIFLAAGNTEEGNEDVVWPAWIAPDYGGIMSIGNVYDSEAADDYIGKTAGQRYTESCHGNDLELCAVGVDVYTSTYDSYDSYSSVTGTSIATPVAAGVTACLIEQYNNVPSSQIFDITPNNIESRLKANADRFSQSADDVGDGTIRGKPSMVNWYDYIDTYSQVYGTVTNFNNMQSSSNTATLQETSYDEYYTWTEAFTSVPPSGWSVQSGAGWIKKNRGGQSGSYAQCRDLELSSEGSGYLQSRTYDTSDADRVELSYYWCCGFYGGTLTVKVYDKYGYWDTVGTYNYDYAWTKKTWSSTNSEYQHSNFKVRYYASISGSQWVGVDTHKVKMRYDQDTYRFRYEFQFTSLDYNAYDDSTLQVYIYDHSGSENLILEYYSNGWQTLDTDLDEGLNQFDVSGKLTSSTFKIRLRGVTDSRDLSRDTWYVSYIRLIVLDTSIGFDS